MRPTLYLFSTLVIAGGLIVGVSVCEEAPADDASAATSQRVSVPQWPFSAISASIGGLACAAC